MTIKSVILLGGCWKLRKTVHEEDYKGFHIQIDAWYVDKHFDWDYKWTKAIKMHYTVSNKDGKVITYSEYPRVISKMKPKKILFFIIHPKRTFEEQVKNGLEKYIGQIKIDIDKDLYEDEITNGLMDSLKGI